MKSNLSLVSALRTSLSKKNIVHSFLKLSVFASLIFISTGCIKGCKKEGEQTGESISKGDGVVKQILTQGNGAEAAPGKTVSVHYTGWLENGTKFDSSVDRGTPFEFVLGAGTVIPGWDQGVAGMKVGEKSKLTIQPALGYGESGAGGVIPPNAVLVFEVELLDVK